MNLLLITSSIYPFVGFDVSPARKTHVQCILSFVLGSLVIPRFISCACSLSQQGVSQRYAEAIFHAVLVRQTSHRPAFHPIDCFCCASCSSLLATAMCLYQQMNMAAPVSKFVSSYHRDPSYLTICVLYSTCCWGSNCRASNQGSAMFISWIRPGELAACGCSDSRANLAKMLQLGPDQPREALLLFL